MKPSKAMTPQHEELERNINLISLLIAYSKSSCSSRYSSGKILVDITFSLLCADKYLYLHIIELPCLYNKSKEKSC